MLSSMADEIFIHPTAVVDQPCRIGPGTKIWHFCHIMEAAEIGSLCVLGQNVFVAAGVKIGERVKIQNNVSIYSGVTIEDEVFVGPSVVFTNVKNPRAAISRNTPEGRLETLVKKGASIGANATLICGITIGSYSFVGAGALVVADVPDFVLVQGNPARPAGFRCICGEEISFTKNAARCLVCLQDYNLSGGRVRVSDAVAER
jgi:UDP-2-acetamido-3-amino-2,3-dideoxy-glucuronate N-acetyltransferase